MNRLLSASFDRRLVTISLFFHMLRPSHMRLSDLIIQINLPDVKSGVSQPDIPGFFDTQKQFGSGNTFTRSKSR
jgi:hypothetical protein